MPFIAKWGNGTPAGSNIQPGVTSTQTISVLDIMATMYDLTNQDMAADEAYDSANLLPILLGQRSDSEPLRDYMMIQAVRGNEITDYSQIANSKPTRSALIRGVSVSTTAWEDPLALLKAVSRASKLYRRKLCW